MGSPLEEVTVMLGLNSKKEHATRLSGGTARNPWVGTSWVGLGKGGKTRVDETYIEGVRGGRGGGRRRQSQVLLDYWLEEANGI